MGRTSLEALVGNVRDLRMTSANLAIIKPLNSNTEPLVSDLSAEYTIDEYNYSRDLLIGQGESIYTLAFDATI